MESGKVPVQSDADVSTVPQQAQGLALRPAGKPVKPKSPLFASVVRKIGGRKYQMVERKANWWPLALILFVLVAFVATLFWIRSRYGR